MKTKVLLSVLTVLLSTGLSFSNSGDTIVIPYGTPATIDGVMSTGEWDDASFVLVPAIMGRVYIKYTDTHFYIAFSDTYGYYASAGIYLDMLNSGGPAPQVHDIWLHGSAAAFEFYGTGSTWQMGTPSGWDYVSNSVNEFGIPFSKLGLVPGSAITIGILFSFLDWSTTHNEITWPAGGFPNCSNPESWGTGIMQVTTGNVDYESNEISLFPNPASTYLFIKTEQLIQRIVFMDLSGKKISAIEEPEKIIALPDVPNGLYFIKLHTDKGIVIKKLLLKH